MSMNDIISNEALTPAGQRLTAQRELDNTIYPASSSDPDLPLVQIAADLEQHRIPPSVTFAINLAKAYAKAYGHVPGAIESLVERTVPLYVDEVTFENLPAIAAYLDEQFPASTPESDTAPKN